MLAGVPVAAAVFDLVGGADVEVVLHEADGAAAEPGDAVLTVTGPTRALLTAERTALNLICHLSGIASLTRRWVDAIEGTGAAVRDTRKTTPGLRALEKYAVRCGGGVNHRMALGDAALVKDNHVAAAGGIAAAVEAVRTAAPDIPLEVECDTLDQVREAIAAGVQLVLLDNFSTADTRTAVELVRGTGRAAGGQRRAVARPGARGRGDRRRLPGRRRAHPQRAGARPRLRPARLTGPRDFRRRKSARRGRSRSASGGAAVGVHPADGRGDVPRRSSPAAGRCSRRRACWAR